MSMQNSSSTGRHEAAGGKVPARLTVALAFFLLTLAIAAGPASALKVRPFLKETFLPAPKGFTDPSDIALNETTHHVWVVENRGTEKLGVYNFTEDGELDSAHPKLTGGSGEPFYVAIDNSGGGMNGYIYAVDFNGIIQQYDPDGVATAVKITAASFPPNGTPQGGGLPNVVNDGSIRPRDPAVGPEGHIYFWDEDHPGVIDEFSSAGTFVAQHSFDGFKFILELSIGPAGQFYFSSEGAIYRLGPEGACLDGSHTEEGEERCDPFLSPEGEDSFSSFSSTPSGRFLVVLSHTVDKRPQLPEELLEYDSAGNLLSTIGKDEVFRIESGAVLDEATDRVYVTDAFASLDFGSGEGRLVIYGPTVILPDAATEAPSDVTDRSALFHGQIGADSEIPSTCVFQYVTEQEFDANGFADASQVPCEPEGPFTDEALAGVEAQANSLSGGTAYRVRLLASNENGSNPGEAIAFKTSGPTVGSVRALEIGTAAATLEATVNPRGIATTYAFQYLIQASFEANGWTAAIEAPAGGSSIALAASGSGNLEAGSKVVTGLGTENGDFAAGQTLSGPGIPPDAKIVTVAPESLTLSSEASQTIPGAALTATEPTTVSQRIEGLVPGTSYRFRLVATGAGGVTAGETLSQTAPFATFALSPVFETCANDALRSVGPSAQLPECRAYEQASPVEKNGASMQGEVNAVQASPDGSTITFFSGLGIPGGEGAQNFPSYAASRASNGSGWTSRGLLPPAATGPYAQILGWSEDLQQVYSENKQIGSPTVFYARDGSEPIETVVDGKGEGREQFNFAGAAEGGAQVLFENSADALLPAAAPAASNAYVWDEATGTVHLAGVLNDGEAPSEGSLAGPYDWYRVHDTEVSGAENSYFLQDAHAISADGTRAFFTAVGPGRLYMRENPTAAQSPLDGEGNCSDPALGCTTWISESQRGIPDPNGEQPAAFLGATADGSRIFFLSSEKLTDDSTGGSGYHLYRYDVGGGLVDLTPDEADVQGILGMSEDGSYVYFAANGVLAPGAQPGKCVVGVEANECNVYLDHEGTTEFVARLRAQVSGGDSDILDWSPTSSQIGGNQILQKTARVSDDGRALLFSSVRNLTSYDSKGRPELYRYGPGEGVACVSCDPTGQAPTGGAYMQKFPLILLGPRPPYGINTRNLSPDGNRVFFQTPDQLVAGDENSVTDVYEWEAKGTGSCKSEVENGGCLYLISTGTSDQPSYFGDADESGNNAFIFTASRLVPQDRDELIDVYDARVGGGVAGQNQVKPVPCEVEACLGPPPAAPDNPSAGSANFVGPGNPKGQPRCPKGKVRRHGRCVKKSKKRHHGNRHKGKGHEKRHARSGGGLGR